MDTIRIKVLLFSTIVCLLALAAKEYLDRISKENINDEERNCWHTNLNWIMLAAIELYIFSYCS